MMRVVISNQRGGVSKTTTTTTLAREFADRGKRVLVIDTDPQGLYLQHSQPEAAAQLVQLRHRAAMESSVGGICFTWSFKLVATSGWVRSALSKSRLVEESRSSGSSNGAYSRPTLMARASGISGNPTRGSGPPWRAIRDRGEGQRDRQRLLQKPRSARSRFFVNPERRPYSSAST